MHDATSRMVKTRRMILPSEFFLGRFCRSDMFRESGRLGGSFRSFRWQGWSCYAPVYLPSISQPTKPADGIAEWADFASFTPINHFNGNEFDIVTCRHERQ